MIQSGQFYDFISYAIFLLYPFSNIFINKKRTAIQYVCYFSNNQSSAQERSTTTLWTKEIINNILN